MIQLGFNGRFFPNDWHPAREEIAFARDNGFAAIQFPGEETGLGAERLGAALADVGNALSRADVIAVMEIVVRLDENGRSPLGFTPFEILQNNLSAIQALGCHCVHWHPVVTETVPVTAVARVERKLTEPLLAAVALAQREGFLFGIEHNSADIPFFSKYKVIAATLEAVAGLGLVWDFNHSPAALVESFIELAPRMNMLHLSDTPLPTLNYHWPIGAGNMDVGGYLQQLLLAGFSGIAILEIGGAPWSGGHGQDSDEALLDALARLQPYTVVRPVSLH